MKFTKGLPQIVYAGLITAGIVGASKKIIDYTQRDLYKNILTQADPHTKSDTLTFSLIPDQKHSTARREKAKKLYQAVALPTPHYETNASVVNNLTGIRIRHSLYPGQLFPTGIEEYPHEIIQAQGTNALCATGTISQLKTANIWSASMWNFFGMQGKDTRKLEQLLSNHGWESIVPTTDHYSYYTTRSETGTLPTHYDNLLRACQTVPANAILTARYAKSGKLYEAQQSGKNATHSLRSLGQIEQILSFEQLGIQGRKLHEFLQANEREQRYLLAYYLMKKRDFSDSVGSYEQNKSRIIQIMDDYPDLLRITRRENKAYFEGTMVDHVYPSQGKPTNYIHYLFELVSYRGYNKDGSLFLVCDGMIPGERSLKHKTYDKLSPLYKQIDQYRTAMIDPTIVGSTYIVNFDDIDLNKNKKIDKSDKMIGEVVQDITKERKEQLSSMGQQELDEQTIHNYLIKYWTIVGATERFPTGTILPLPHLDNHTQKHIDTTYISYTKVYEEFRNSSRQKYYDYIEKQVLPQWISIQTIQNQGAIIYPITNSDTDITITLQIMKWLDIINKHNKDVTIPFQLHQLPNEELQHIYYLIKPAINYKTTKTIQPGQTLEIDLYQALGHLQPYFQTYQHLEQNQLDTITHPISQQFDQVMQQLQISSANRAIINHYLLRETGYTASIFNIASSQARSTPQIWKRLNRGRTKMAAEQLDFDDSLGSIYRIESQGPLQLRFKYFLQQKEELQKLINACRDLINSKLLNTTQNNQLQEIIYYGQILYKELEHNRKQSESYKHLQHLLSDLINFTPNSLTHPEQDPGTLLSIKLTDLQITKYKYHFARIIQIQNKNKKLTPEEVGFIQEMCYLTNHYGLPKGKSYMIQALTHYYTEKEKNPEYSWKQLSEEAKLQHIYHYINTIPPHSDAQSAGLRLLSLIIGLCGLRHTHHKKTTINHKTNPKYRHQKQHKPQKRKPPKRYL